MPEIGTFYEFPRTAIRKWMAWNDDVLYGRRAVSFAVLAGVERLRMFVDCTVVERLVDAW